MAVVRNVLALLLVAALWACGAAPAAKSPGPLSDDVDVLADELEAAERTLSAELGPPSNAPGAAPPKPAEPGTGEPPSREEDKDAETAKPSAEPPAAQSARPPASSPCDTACKALASMKRSQARICEIAGAAHERCEWAKQKVAEATTRIERSGCACDA